MGGGVRGGEGGTGGRRGETGEGDERGEGGREKLRRGGESMRSWLI